jgi:hypothetical protein
METQTASATSIAPPAAAKVRKVVKKVGRSRQAVKKVIAKQHATAAKRTTGDGTPLKAICSALKIEPRLARRKLRAANLAFHGAKERWSFTDAQAAKVKEILRA